MQFTLLYDVLSHQYRVCFVRAATRAPQIAPAKLNTPPRHPPPNIKAVLGPPNTVVNVRRGGGDVEVSLT